MDDYSALRSIENSVPSEKAIIYPIRKALSWERSLPLGLPGKAFQGDNFYTAPNLGPEALVTYYYNETYTSLKENRTKTEKELIENIHNKSLAFIGSTGIPIPIAAAAIESITHLQQNQDMITELQKKSVQLKTKFLV